MILKRSPNCFLKVPETEFIDCKHFWYCLNILKLGNLIYAGENEIIRYSIYIKVPILDLLQVWFAYNRLDRSDHAQKLHTIQPRLTVVEHPKFARCEMKICWHWIEEQSLLVTNRESRNSPSETNNHILQSWPKLSGTRDFSNRTCDLIEQLHNTFY